jgi:Ala-tRNA(Pro) deacylase
MNELSAEDLIMPLQKLREFLDGHGIRYVVISHSRAYTAQETAESAHIKGQEFAKTIIAKLDGEMAMAILPASEKVDLDLLAAAADAKKAELASEHEFQSRFPQCEVGAMPPFGNLYGMDVYVEESMAGDEKIAFNAGAHTELVQLKFGDFVKLVKPKVVRISKSYS